MIGRIVEISNNNRYLSVYRGFLLVKSLGEEASELLGELLKYPRNEL